MASLGEIVFEIYPRQKEEAACEVRLGFRVDSLQTALEKLQQLKPVMISSPKETPWGKRSVLQDPDGHTIELLETP